MFLILEKGRKEIHNTLRVWPTWRGQYDPDVRKEWAMAKPEAGDVGTTTLWWIWDFILRTTGLYWGISKMKIVYQIFILACSFQLNEGNRFEKCKGGSWEE